MCANQRGTLIRNAEVSLSSRSLQTRLRPTDALGLWHRVLCETVQSDGPDLSARQLAILMTIYLQPAPHTVRDLAERLNVQKCVVTRAIDSLGRLGFLGRSPDPRDKRSVLIHRTPKGTHYLTQFGQLIAREIQTSEAHAEAASSFDRPAIVRAL